MKSRQRSKQLMLFSIWKTMANELAIACRTNATKDIEYALRRYEHEGLSFLTITLPAFGKDFERFLEEGKVSDDMFRSFRSTHTGLPHFLGGFLRRVFKRCGDGFVIQDDSDAVFAVRQLCYLFAKLNLRCTNEREEQSYGAFCDVEQELREPASTSVDEEEYLSLYRHCRTLLLASCLSRVDQLVYRGDLIPKHGPGATSDPLYGNQKWRLPFWTDRLEELFPYREYASVNYREREVTHLDPVSEPPVKVTSVTKTQKAPRIIAIEPTHMQYMQQAIARPLSFEIENDPMVGHFIKFRDSSQNRMMARRGSIDRSLSTIDLSEASDRVTLKHVDILLENTPWLRQAVNSSRSLRAKVPGHDIIELQKFASMGSALTFPIETIVFLTVVLVGISKSLNRRLTRQDLTNLIGRVSVFGDDIIVPSEYSEDVYNALKAFGFKINETKSFFKGPFRESCGGDFFNGDDVNPVKLRYLPPRTRHDHKSLISLVAFRNLCYAKGLWATARFVDDWFEDRNIPFPIVDSTSRALGRNSFTFSYESNRVCHNLHRPLVKALIEWSYQPKCEIDGDEAALKCLTGDFSDAQFRDRKSVV